MHIQTDTSYLLASSSVVVVFNGYHPALLHEPHCLLFNCVGSGSRQLGRNQLGIEAEIEEEEEWRKCELVKDSDEKRTKERPAFCKIAHHACCWYVRNVHMYTTHVKHVHKGTMVTNPKEGRGKKYGYIVHVHRTFLLNCLSPSPLRTSMCTHVRTLSVLFLLNLFLPLSSSSWVLKSNFLLSSVHFVPYIQL